MVAIENGAVTLYYDNVAKFATSSAGATLSGQLTLTSHLDMGDGDQIMLGDGNDLRIYHDGSNSYVSEAGTGQLMLTGSHVYLKNSAKDETMLWAAQNGAVTLYYDNAGKLATTSTGVSVTGVMAISGGSPADGKVWTATDGNGTGNWETVSAGMSEVDVMVFSILFG